MGIYFFIGNLSIPYTEALKIVIHKTIADHRRRVARLNRYVAVVALLWLVTSFAILFFSKPRRDNIAGSQHPASYSVDRAELPFRLL